MNLSRALDFIIEYSFYFLFFLVPLIWLPINYELFEFNKMILTYFLTIVIVGSWFLKILITKNFRFKRTFLDLPILIFLASNILSTIFSIDPHTSIFGYYSRFHGGLLSTIAYILLYFSLVNNLDKKKVTKLIIVGLISGFLVAVYGILQHPNPLFAKMENGQKIWHGIDYEYWAEQVEIRVFSTLGQPNWLAAYLAMLLPLSLSFMLIMKRLWQKIFFLLVSTSFLLATTFTLSRGGTLGLLTAILVYSLFLFAYPSTLKDRVFRFFHLNIGWPKILEKGWVWLTAFVIIIILINNQFGNALQARGTTNSLSNEPPPESPNNQTQLEVAGAQTGVIRLIVWEGALDIFKHYPITGTGVETFGFSYYLFRPIEHNMTVEWDFLYNKAHNEYLNYLANNGAVGLLAYLILIGAFIFWAVRYLLKTVVNRERLLVLAILASYVGFLVQNFFGFSVVVLALLFFLFPAAAFVLTEETKEKELFNTKIRKNLSQTNLNRLLQLIVVVIATYSILFVARIWLADTFYAQSGSVDHSTNYQNLRTAVDILPSEPLFQSELALAGASLAVDVDDDELRKDLVEEAAQTSKELEDDHPHNTTLARNRLQTMFALSQIDEKFTPEAIEAGKKLAELAPTDASIQYNLALIYMLTEKEEEALKQVEKVLKLKPDYQDAKDLQARLRSS